MKHEGQFYHDKEGFASLGITDERAEQIKDFINNLIKEGRKHRYRRSEVCEKIIDFAENVIEAVGMKAYFEQKLRRGIDIIPDGVQAGVIEINEKEDGSVNVEIKSNKKPDARIIDRLIGDLKRVSQSIKEKDSRINDGDDILKTVDLN